MKLTLDPHPFARRGSSVIFGCSLMHLAQATLLAGWPESAFATGMLALARWAVFGLGLYALIAAMVASASLALVGTFYRVGKIRIFLFAWQQLLFGVMAYGGIAAATNGAYLDATVVPWPQILNDQLAYTTLFGLHLWAIWQRSWDPNG